MRHPTFALSQAFICAATLGATLLSQPAAAAADMVYIRGIGESSQIFRSDDQGRNERPLTAATGTHIYPRLSADGHQVTWAEGSETTALRIVVSADARDHVEEFTETSGWHLQPNFSGDGRLLAFSSSATPGGQAVIKIIDIAGARERNKFRSIDRDGTQRLLYTGAVTTITEDGNKLYFPLLSSDGSVLIYQRTIDANHKEIVKLDLQTNEKTILTDAGGYAQAPSLSADDRQLAYVSRVDGQTDLFIKDLKTGAVMRLTNDAASDADPSFHPDGSIVYSSTRGGEHYGLYRVPVASIRSNAVTVETVLTSTEGDVFTAEFSGDLGYTQGLLAPMSDPPRSSFGTVRVGERIYVAGGHQGHEHTYPPESFLDVVEYYDLASNTWHRTAPRSVACHGYSLAAHDKYIYAFGGFAYSAEHTPKWKSLDLIERYDTEQDRWEVVGHLPRPRSSYVLGVVDEKVYLIGGWDSTPRREGDAEGTFHRAIDIFDLATETAYESSFALPDPLRRALSVETVGDEIILVGGLGQGASHFELLDKVTAFNPRTGAWRELPALPFATFAPAAGVIGGKLYMFGGMFKTGDMDYRYVNHIFELPLGTDHWQHTGRYLTGTKGFSMVVPLSERGLAILGGHSYADDTDAPVQTVESFELR